MKKPMRILTYKRTHIGDPDKDGCFGIYDCMGRIRNYQYDAVIGVGGIGKEAKSYKIDRKINWIGINPTKIPGAAPSSVVVKFEKFLLLEHEGPLLNSKAPKLARHLYERNARFLLKSYSKSEQREAEAILAWALKKKQSKRMLNSFNSSKGCKNRCKLLRDKQCK